MWRTCLRSHFNTTTLSHSCRFQVIDGWYFGGGLGAWVVTDDELVVMRVSQPELVEWIGLVCTGAGLVGLQCEYLAVGVHMIGLLGFISLGLFGPIFFGGGHHHLRSAAVCRRRHHHHCFMFAAAACRYRRHCRRRCCCSPCQVLLTGSRLK